MDLRQLRHFVQVADLGSLTRAADHLNLAQPALSRDIRALEKDLATRLFWRNGRGVAPTEAGARFLAAVRPHLEGLDRARDEMLAQGPSQSGLVRLGWTGTISAPIGADIVSRFRAELPGVTLETIGGSSAQIQELIESGRIDLGIHNAERRARGSQVEHLMRCDLFHFSRNPGQDAAPQGGTIPLAEAAQHPLLLFGRQHAMRRAIDNAARGLGITLQVLAQIDEFQAMRRMILDSDATAILPLSLVGNWESDPRLLIRRVVEPQIVLYFCATYPRGETTFAATELARIVHRVVRQAIADGKLDGSL